MKKYTLYLFVVFVSVFYCLAAMDTSFVITLQPPVEKFVYHRCVPALHTIATAKIAAELTPYTHFEKSLVSLSDDLYWYVKNFQVNTRRTDALAALKLKFCSKKVDEDVFKKEFSLLSSREVGVKKHMLSHAELPQKSLDEFLEEANNFYETSVRKFLIKRGAKSVLFEHLKELHPIYYAIAYGDIDEVKKIVVNEPDVVNMNPEAILLATKFGEASILEILLKNFSQKKIDEGFLDEGLIKAVQSGIALGVELFIERGANIHLRNTWGASPLYLAVDKGFVDCVKLLIQGGAEINKEGLYRPLVAAVENGFYDIASMLIQAGAEINIGAKRGGGTLLHTAVEEGFIDIVSLLVRSGAEVNVKNEEMETPLSLAVNQRRADIVAVLVQGGADVNEKNRWGETLLYRAAEKGQADIVSILADRGVDINEKSNAGYTPLHRAVSGHFILTVDMLLQKGADLTIKSGRNSDGITPLEMAELELYTLENVYGQMERIEIVRLLKEALRKHNLKKWLLCPMKF